MRSINQCRKMQPAGTTLQTNDSLPIMDNNSRLVHFFNVQKEWIAVNNDDLHLDEILAFMATVSSTIPRKVRQVVGPQPFLS